jgi:hypothetical protein
VGDMHDYVAWGLVALGVFLRLAVVLGVSGDGQ